MTSPRPLLPRLLAWATCATLAAPAAALAAPASVTAASPTAAPTSVSTSSTSAYIVVRRDDATSVSPKTVTADVRARRASAARSLAARVGATPTSTTSTVLTSFSARLTPAQVRALATDPQVASVTPVHRRHVDAVGTPASLGLTGSGPGSWTSYGGTAAAGRGVVIGIVDSGIWPESPAFAGTALTATPSTTVGQAYRPTPTTTAMRKADGGTFHGDCSGRAGHLAVQSWSPSACTSTLVSARAFVPAEAWTNPGPTNPLGREFASPRDGLGHGTHTASTAAGRPVRAVVDGIDYGQSTGVAPGAAIASYKACWSGLETDAAGTQSVDNSCWDDALVAAIDQAVADGVDVLSLSISGTTTDPRDPVELALLGAARAGVLVSASAGNDTYARTDVGTVNHPAPWAMTVGNTSWYGTPAIDEASGLGPTTAFAGAVLKPDVVAPGIDILASVPPQLGQAAATPAFESMTGTSMATPHAAGLGALLLGAHPTWSPMMVRSALALTAVPIPGVSAFAQGSGRLDARTMTGADLLLDATGDDYLAVARSAGLAGTTPTKAPVDLNTPFVVLPDVAVRSSTTRTFTTTRAGAWAIGATLPGYRVTVSPRRGLALRAGQLIHLTVSVTRTTAARGGYAQGAITLDGGRSVLRMPLLARTR